MARAERRSTGLVRLTVTSDLCRVDLVVPSCIPVADLLPELARCVGVLDAHTAYSGIRAVTHAGRVLRGDAGLAAQRVVDGDIITVSTGLVDDGPARQDDPVEAVAMLVVGQHPAVGESWRRWAMLGAGGLSLLLGAAALAWGPSSDGAVMFSTALAVALFIAVVVGSRAGRRAVVVATLAYGCCLYSAVAGLRWGTPSALDGVAVARAGGAVLVSSAALTVVMARRGLVLLPAMTLSSISLMVGAAVSTLGLAVAPLLTCLLTAVLFTALALPAGALAVTRTGRHRAEQDAASPWRPVDMARIARDLELARELLVVGAATTGLLLVVLTPVAVSLRPFGFLVPGIGGLLLVLRSRHHRATVDVVCMGVSGLLGVVATAGESVLWPGSSWRLPGGVLVALGGSLAVLESLREGTGGGVRRGRLCHALETLALGALVPALLLVVGSSLAMS